MSAAGSRPARRFFALWPGQETRHQLARAARGCLVAGAGRPVAPADFHLTLLFLGTPDARQQAGLVAAARELAVPAFDLVLDRCGCFEAAGVLWLGCSVVPVALAELAAALAAQARALGLQIDPRPFRPHVSIARRPAMPPRQVVVAPPVRWQVGGFALLASRDGVQGGARYLVEHRFPDSG
ncbi:MAG: RNA 2',3'-cyclic phosphodiesterase [Gammaproteobacteria bacterium]|nr:RNA 2',3'-cyclic phosphodiesterase [Gammaproteobacteria bacterium]